MLLSKAICGLLLQSFLTQVDFKVARMSKSIMQSHDELIIRKLECYETGLEDDKQADLLWMM